VSKTQHDSATPAHGRQVISAVAFIHKDFSGVTKVFLPKRADSKVFLPGLYEMIGGHIDYAEDIIDGLKREIKEEIGMDATIGDPFSVFTYMNNVKGSHSIEVVYFGQFTSPIEDIKINPDDHSGFGWFTKEEVIENKDYIIPPTESTDTDDHGDDPEYNAILRGFEIIEGKSLKTS
jgi:8-oxo-dGTP diphosphatase